MNSLIWLHEDSLRDTHPVFNRVDGDCHAFFIWDNAYLKRLIMSLIDYRLFMRRCQICHLRFTKLKLRL